MTFDGSFFIMTFVMFRHVNFFPPFIVICTHSKHYKTSNVHLIMCVLYGTTIERVIGPKENSSFFLKYFFDMYFNNLMKLYGSHHYYVTQLI